MTNEEIAEKAANLHRDEHDLWWIGMSPDASVYPTEEMARKRLPEIVEALLPLLQQARQAGAAEALDHQLPDPPMSEAEIGQWRDALMQKRIELGVSSSVHAADCCDLLDQFIKPIFSHIRWLTRRLQDVSIGEQWGDGYRAGYAAAKEEDKDDLESLERARAYADDLRG